MDPGIVKHATIFLGDKPIDTIVLLYQTAPDNAHISFGKNTHTLLKNFAAETGVTQIPAMRFSRFGGSLNVVSVILEWAEKEGPESKEISNGAQSTLEPKFVGKEPKKQKLYFATYRGQLLSALNENHVATALNRTPPL